MKKESTVLIKLGVAAFLSMTTVTTAFGGTWQSDGGNWRYFNDSGSPAGSGWIQDGNDYYQTDENGYMKTGWQQDLTDGGRWYYLNPQQGGPQGAMITGWLCDNGLWYFLDTRIGGPRGAMLTGWQWIDGKCYYLDPARGGAMAVSGTVSDGWQVNDSGAWTDDNGTPYFIEGMGISSTVAVDITSGAGSERGTAFNGSDDGAVGSDSEWSNYSDNSVGRAANNFQNGNYGMMDSDEQEEVRTAIEEFKDTYITSGMSDFEKEIMIIKWLVQNCSYEKADDWENSTAFSCIINGKAQCSGYADAFLQTAKQCGLDARYIHNSTHAWNLIKLGGDWYHVDVTWEDPIGENPYGFSQLRNRYINLEDSEIRSISSHRQWAPDTIKAKGVKYGRKVVAQYLKDGTIDTSKGQSFKNQVNRLFEKAKNEDGSNIINYTDVDTAADRIAAYLECEIDAKKDTFEFMVRYPSSYAATVTGNYSKLVRLNNQIEELVNDRINTKYQNILKNPLKISLFLETDADSCYYTHTTGRLYYQSGQGKMVDYLIHFIDQDGNEVGTQSGTGEKGSNITLVFPDGYSWISNASENFTVNQGKAGYSGKSFRIQDDDPVDMDVRLRAVKSKNSSLQKATGSSADMAE